MSTTNFPTIELGKVAKVIPGFAFKSKDWCDNGIPVIKIKNISGDLRVDADNCDHVPEELLTKKTEKYLLFSGDIVVAMTGATAGKEGKISATRKLLLNQRVAKVVPTEIDPDFLWAIMSADDFQAYLYKLADGAAQPNMSGGQIEGVKIPCPDKKTQEEIGKIISNYDNLIENNNRRIAILEEMAQSLYREWFVKFRFPGHENAKFIDSPLGKIPEGWEVKKLADLASINPESITKKNAPDNIRYIDIKSVGIGTIDEIKPMPFSEAPSRARRIVRDGDIIWATVRPNRKQYSYIAKPEENTVVSTGFAVIRAAIVPKSYLMQVTSTDGFVSYLVNHATGAAYPAVNSKDFEDADILVPSDVILNMFDGVCSAVIEQCELLKKKNCNLAGQRGLLLPKLIGGSVSMS